MRFQIWFLFWFVMVLALVSCASASAVPKPVPKPTPDLSVGSEASPEDPAALAFSYCFCALRADKDRKFDFRKPSPLLCADKVTKSYKLKQWLRNLNCQRLLFGMEDAKDL